jgi:predicted dinucleotide-binding enzyme
MSSDLGVWTSEDSALVLIDYQAELLESIRSETGADLVELHARWLAKTAKAFDMPIVLSTVGVEGGVFGPTQPGFASNAEFVKSKTKGPTAKSFNVNFASLFGRLADARTRPGNLWCGDDEAREVVERLNRDAGYDPVRTGPLESAAAQEAVIGVIFGIAEEMGPYVYRFAPVDQL